MYPPFLNKDQIYDVSIGTKRLTCLVAKNLQLYFQNIIFNILNSYDSLDEVNCRQFFCEHTNEYGPIYDVKKLDSGIYIFIDRYILLFDSQAISTIEPSNLIDRVYFHTEKGEYVVKLFYYPYQIKDFLTGYTLGLTRQGHDSSAALIDNATGQVVSFEREERPLRVKPARDFPTQAIRDVLDMAGVQVNQIKSISLGQSLHWFEDTPSSTSPALNCYKNLGEEFLKKDFGSRNSRNNILKRIKEALPDLDIKTIPIYFVRHHIAHAASMPVKLNESDGKSLFLVMDGRGEWDTVTAWILENGDLINVLNTGMPHSLGYLYNMMGRFMGWRDFGFEGQIMGLAPYGKPQTVHEVQIYKTFANAYKEFAQISPETLQVNLDRKYFEGGYRPEHLAQISGWVSPYIPSKFFLDLIAPYTGPLPGSVQIDPSNHEHRPVCILAFALQTRTQDLILSLIENIKIRFPQIKRLYLSGGVALNVSINGEIIRRDLFTNDNLITTPVPGDDGLSIGAAIYLVRHFHKHQDFPKPYGSALLGREYDVKAIKATLDRFGLNSGNHYTEYSTFDELIESVVNLIEQGYGIAWFQGREEAGPRALGARSILFPMIDPNSNLRANKAKRRQPWRPSAISLLEEDASAILENCTSAPYMSIAFMPKLDYQNKIQSGLHPMDNSTRPQTVCNDEAPHLYKLLKKLKLRTGLGAIINTSLNRSESIVHYPDDALNTLHYLDGVEFLAISNFLIKKGNYKPSIIAASEELDLKNEFRAFRESGSALEFIKRLLAYSVTSHQVYFKIAQDHTLPMFKEGFDEKIMASLLDQFCNIHGFSKLPLIEIEPQDTPYKPVLLRLLAYCNRNYQ